MINIEQLKRAAAEKNEHLNMFVGKETLLELLNRLDSYELGLQACEETEISLLKDRAKLVEVLKAAREYLTAVRTRPDELLRATQTCADIKIEVDQCST
jgi:hypothetical protein